MVTQGGEVAFVTRMIDQSRDLQERCQWFTSMLGKGSSVEQIIEKIKEAGVTNFAVTDLMPGHATKRWVVGWSWGSYRPSEAVARASSTLPKHLLPFPTEYKLAPWAATIDTCAHTLNHLMQELEMQWRYKTELSEGVGFAKANVWSRAARRKRGQASKTGADDFEEDEPEEPALAVKISIRLPRKGAITATVRWLQGRDSVLFESFCGMLKRRLSEGSTQVMASRVIIAAAGEL
ncbi:MAG: hypothetical protein OHK93_004952 [Ramalina farinacea]|uniref:Uncharacterized protein n=1 Tax=Ramalina farinacea TaxID=258253 RepID=A0AA43QV69_9LECA|nr:hypothetical protein [Ramalina farinacea]